MTKIQNPKQECDNEILHFKLPKQSVLSKYKLSVPIPKLFWSLKIGI
jgi:hypothetical protein